MLSIRKLHHHIRSVSSSSSSFSLFIAADYNIARISKWKQHADWGHKSVSPVKGSYFTNLYLQAMVLDFRPSQLFSTVAGTMMIQDRDPAKLCMELDNSLEEHRVIDMWKLYKQHMEIDGFPRKSTVNNLLSCSAQTLDLQCLEKAYELVEKTFGMGKQDLLEKETLVRLSFALAKCGSPVPASTILRKLIEMEEFPPVAAWSAIMAHMCLTTPGAYLAADLILEIGCLFQDGRFDSRKTSDAHLISMKPNTISLNIVLAGCLLFNATIKAEQLLDLMLLIGVKADASLLVMVAHIYEKNGTMEELKNLQRHIHKAHNLTEIQIRQFYSCLVACHLNFGDLDSASHVVLEMLRKEKEAQNSLPTATLVFKAAGSDGFLQGQDSFQGLTHRKPDDSKASSVNRTMPLSYEDFSRDSNFMKFETEAKEILDTLLARLQGQVVLITTEHGILQPKENIYMKLVKAFLSAGKTKKFVELLIKAKNEDSSVSTDDSFLVQIINSCISLGWLDQAGDLLEKMRLARVRTGSSVYASLLKAYKKANQPGRVTTLLRDVRNARIEIDLSCYEALIGYQMLQEDTGGEVANSANNQNFELLVKGCEEGGDANLMAKLLKEINDGRIVDSGVHDWNSVIYFFARKRLMPEARRALMKMRRLGHVPNAQTFHSMVTGYASVDEKYHEVKELWSEMKSIAASNSLMKFDQEVLESFLYKFVRGGFFSLANEVVEIIERENILVNKYKYQTLFLCHHKKLYEGKTPKFLKKAQSELREAVLAFRKWVTKF